MKASNILRKENIEKYKHLLSCIGGKGMIQLLTGVAPTFYKKKKKIETGISKEMGKMRK